MKQQLIIGSIAGALAAAAIGAVAGSQFLDRQEHADVIAVQPATKTVSVPRQECRDEVITRTAATRDPNQIAGTVVGAVVGGVLGNQIGGGTGKKVATVGGAVAGGYAGNKVQEGMQERNTYQETQHNCTTVHDSRREPAGYEVTYRLDGVVHRVHMDHDPGATIPVENGAIVLNR
jgi:uncharacterized protein YcfJ